MSGKFWSADLDGDDGWAPHLEWGGGCIPSLSIWFDSKAECEAWIRDVVIGAEMDPEVTA